MLLPEPAPDYSEDRFYTGSPELKPLPFTTACTAKKLPPHARQRVTNRLYYGKGAQRTSGSGGSAAAADDAADAAAASDGVGVGSDSILRRRQQQSPLWRREQKLQRLREARAAALDAPHNPSVVHKRKVKPASMDVLTQRLSESARKPRRTSDAALHVSDGGWRRTTDVTQRAKQYCTMADPHLRGFWLRREILLQVSTGSLARSTRYQSFTKAPTVPTGDRLPTLPSAARGADTPQHRREEIEDLFRRMPADLEACCRTPQGSVQALLPPLQQPHASSDDIEHIIKADAANGAAPSPAKPVESTQRESDGDSVSSRSSDTSSYVSQETSSAATPRGDADAASLAQSHSQSQSQSRASSPPPPLRAPSSRSSRSSSVSYSSSAPSSGGVV